MWFGRIEFESRLSRLQAALNERGLDALIAFQPETVTWVTGFYTRAYTNYHLAVIPAAGEPSLLCRNVSRYYAERTFAFDDIAYWTDGEDKDGAAIALIVKRLGRSARLGVELSSWMMSTSRFGRLCEELPDTQWVDVGDLVPRMRLVKSAAEIAYQRRAALAAEAAMRAAAEAAKPGRNELDVAAAACAALVLAGSDTPGPGVLSSGERANHLHGGYMNRLLQHGDTIQYEPTPNVRHYNARFMRTMKVGGATEAQLRAAEQLIAVQDRALAEVAPGVAAREADRLYRDGILATGLVDTYTNKTFYSIGLIMNPSDAEPLEATPEATWRFEPGMVFHSYLLVDGFGLSETILVTETGHERLTNYPRELIVT